MCIRDRAWTAGVWGLGDKAIAGKLWLVPVRDAVSAVVWVAGLFSDKISWRGLEYRVKKGILLPVHSSVSEVQNVHIDPPAAGGVHADGRYAKKS